MYFNDTDIEMAQAALDAAELDAMLQAGGRPYNEATDAAIVARAAYDGFWSDAGTMFVIVQTLNDCGIRVPDETTLWNAAEPGLAKARREQDRHRAQRR